MISKLSTTIENQIQNQYGNSNTLPKSLLFDHITPATKLLEKRRQMFEVQEALNAQKDEFARREDAFRRREDALRRKDLELQESLIKFNKFLQENELKRNRALKRVADERKQRETKEIEIKKLDNILTQKSMEDMNLKIELQTNMKYQEYLEMVVQNVSKYFPEISDILNRHKILRDANKSLLAKQENEELEQERLNREYLLFVKEKENKILNLNNEIADLQIRLETIKLKSSQLQADVDQRTNETTQKSLFIGQIISSVSNLLERCEENFRRRHYKPMVDHATIEKLENATIVAQCERTLSNLHWVELYLQDFRSIREEFEAENNNKNMKPPVGLMSPTAAGGSGNGNGGNAPQQVVQVIQSQANNLPTFNAPHGGASGSLSIGSSADLSNMTSPRHK